MPDFGSSTTTTSASVSATPSWSRAASTASSTVLPVISTHSIDYWPFRGRLSLERGCGLDPPLTRLEPDEPTTVAGRLLRTGAVSSSRSGQLEASSRS